ncbi:uncharacterized protein LOC125681333 [Ostrea edulis]|uniref:uncharacterized protein LOC125681333 n=1 Tax=Ostrea edulis TaxID=37623 RepID=UPI002094B4DE|nr:uncharacterized protein LOC125681333 [Ostrea edulis]XP_048777327.1 uncharacterized protein LOC125681333 [Ostrea edulis]XP_056013506.1 uncharacterized protein LOC125681333 [Ostrea edulis]
MNRCDTDPALRMNFEMITEDNNFLFYTYGIALSIVVGIGIPGNCFALVILMHRTLQSSPVSIVKALTIHGIINMCFSIYLDIIPSIEMHMETENFNSDIMKYLLQYECGRNFSVSSPSDFQCLRHIDVFVNTTHSLLAQMKPVYDQLVNGSIVSGRQPFIIENCIFDGMEDLQMSGGPVSNQSISNNDPRVDISSSNSSFNSVNPTMDKDIGSFIEKAVGRFIGYTLVNFGLLITFCLAIERCVAIYFPFQAVRWLTIRKTRISLVLIFLACVSTHLPQMVKEISLAKSNSSLINENRDKATSSFVEPIRKEYERFYALISLIICIATFSLNFIVLFKLIILHRKLKYCKHSVNAQRTEINITVAIVVLIFFQLPFHIMAATIAFIQSSSIIHNVNSFIKATVLIRFFFISQSALNFIIYCILARNCRKVCRILFRKLSLSFTRKTTSLTHQDDKIDERVRRIYSNSLTTVKATEKDDVRVQINPLDEIPLHVLTEPKQQYLDHDIQEDKHIVRNGGGGAVKKSFV